MPRVINVPATKLAEVALGTMEQASVKADDATLALVQATRTFLRGIADGSIVCTSKEQGKPAQDVAGSDGITPAAAPTPIAPGTAVRGGDGIIPERVSGAPHPESDE